MKNCFILVITKGHIFESHITLKLSIRYRTICRMRMLPCPHTGSFSALCNISIAILFCIDKSYIAIIVFRLLIDQIEDTLCTCKSHDDGVKLLCDLHERLSKALGELKIGSHHSKCDSADSCDREDSAKHCGQNKLQISDVSDNRSHHVTIFICLCRTFKESFVQFVKFLFGFLLMVKNLDNTLSIHTLFHKACHLCQ